MNRNIFKNISAWQAGIIQSRAFRNVVAFREAILAKYDLGSPEWFALGYIAHETKSGGVRVGDIASTLDVQSTYATAILRKLENKRLVELRPDEQDRRVRMVTATSKGSSLAKEIDNEFITQLEAWLPEIAEEAAQNYLDVMQLIGQRPQKLSGTDLQNF